MHSPVRSRPLRNEVHTVASSRGYNRNVPESSEPIAERGTGLMDRAKVVALIVTFRRREDVLATLDSVMSQSRRVDRVVVVDNSPERECRKYIRPTEQIDLVETGANLGYSGGLHVGLLHILAKENDGYVWILDDDSAVSPNSLAHALTVLSDLPRQSSLSNRGFEFGWGTIRVLSGGPHPRRVEAALVDGGLFPLSPVRRAGPPRQDFFMVFEDADFTLRLSRAGSPIYIADAVVSSPLHRGSSGATSSWRGYYQTRNSLRTAIDLRHSRLMIGSLARLTKQVTWLMMNGDNTRGSRISLRIRGLRDAFGNRMGRTIDPSG